MLYVYSELKHGQLATRTYVIFGGGKAKYLFFLTYLCTLYSEINVGPTFIKFEFFSKPYDHNKRPYVYQIYYQNSEKNEGTPILKLAMVKRLKVKNSIPKN